jgi:hypothetical protein
VDTLTVALLEPVDFSKIQNRLPPGNDSERLLFRNLFENLVQLDCLEAVRPGLAQVWRSDSGGRVWTFTLEPDSRIQENGLTPADHIAVSWKRDDVANSLGIASTVAVDGRQLRVSLLRADMTPSLFADPSLAITTTSTSADQRDSGRMLIPARRRRPMLEFRFQPHADARDALDRGADLMVSRDPALVEYARGLPEFTTFPLAWSHTYTLLELGTGDPLVRAGLMSQQSLARDAVQADARPAEKPAWWQKAAACPARHVSHGSTLNSRIVYIRGDEVARGLAERIVALQESGSGLRTEALNAAEFTARLRNGSERAYILALPRRTLAPCRDAADLPAGARIQPLIDTRAHAVVRKGAPPLWAEWDGTVRVPER